MRLNARANRPTIPDASIFDRAENWRAPEDEVLLELPEEIGTAAVSLGTDDDAVAVPFRRSALRC